MVLFGAAFASHCKRWWCAMIYDKDPTLIFLLMICFFFASVGWHGGLIHAHQIVATECEKQGRFYVGDKVFHCKQGGGQ